MYDVFSEGIWALRQIDDNEYCTGDFSRKVEWTTRYNKNFYYLQTNVILKVNIVYMSPVAINEWAYTATQMQLFCHHG